MLRPRPLIVGQAPGLNTDPARPLFPHNASCAGGRLMESMGLGLDEYLDSYDRVNLIQFHPGKTLEGEDKFPRHEARVRAGLIRAHNHDRPAVVLLGRAVAACWGGFTRELPFLTWTVDPHFGTTVAVVPHTSGRNLWYNNPDNSRAARRFWQALLASLAGELEAGTNLRGEQLDHTGFQRA